MNKAWGTHPLCKRCKKVRTKNTYCAHCRDKVTPRKRRGQHLTTEQKDNYRARAKLQFQEDGLVEIDDDAPVSWAPDGDKGAYVQAWVWVDDGHEIPYG